MGGDRIPGPLDEEHALDALIADLKALHRAIPEMILVLTMAKVGARREAASR
jgi:hypothetical protein